MINLFEMEDCPSPRLQWMDRHGIWTRRTENGWMATAKGIAVTGMDEDEAMTKLAIAMNIKLWNEV